MLTLKDELLNISIADIKSNDNSLFPDWEIKFKAIFLVIYFSAIAKVVTDNSHSVCFFRYVDMSSFA